MQNFLKTGWQKWFSFNNGLVQVNLCQKLFYLQNMGRTCCVQKLIWMSQTFFKIIICFKCWFWEGESNNCNMLSWMNPCYLQFICNLTEFVSHIVTPGSLKRVVEKYAKRCTLESVQKWSFQLFYWNRVQSNSSFLV